MKASILLTLALVLLSAISSLTKASDPVLDTDGNELQVGIPYNLIGVGPGSGPISVGKSSGSHRCPQNVIKNPFAEPPFPKPTPVTFYPANSSETVVRVAKDYNFIFYLLMSCPSNVWMVHPYDESKEQYFVTTGGQHGHPGCGNINSWFQIVPVDGTAHYKLITNPQVCDHHNWPVDLTVVEQNGQGRLYANVGKAPNKPEVIVAFEKAYGRVEVV